MANFLVNVGLRHFNTYQTYLKIYYLSNKYPLQIINISSSDVQDILRFSPEIYLKQGFNNIRPLNNIETELTDLYAYSRIYWCSRRVVQEKISEGVLFILKIIINNYFVDNNKFCKWWMINLLLILRSVVSKQSNTSLVCRGGSRIPCTTGRWPSRERQHTILSKCPKKLHEILDHRGCPP